MTDLEADVRPFLCRAQAIPAGNSTFHHRDRLEELGYSLEARHNQSSQMALDHKGRAVEVAAAMEVAGYPERKSPTSQRSQALEYELVLGKGWDGEVVKSSEGSLWCQTAYSVL